MINELAREADVLKTKVAKLCDTLCDHDLDGSPLAESAHLSLAEAHSQLCTAEMYLRQLSRRLRE